MFLHIGDNEIVTTSKLIGIFSIETMREREGNRRLEARARAESRWFKISGKEDRSVALIDGNEFVVSPISVATLAKRLRHIELNFERGTHDQGER